MITRFPSASAIALSSLLVLPHPVSAHMVMKWPYPLRSKYNPATPPNMIDYNMAVPLQASGSDFPCKGYQNDTPEDIVAMYNTGSTYNMTLGGSATHGGGSCQLSLSYDGGKTFKVIKSMIGGCPLKSTYDFTIPSYAPTGKALFAWTWSNFMGNREFYMNCAAVHIMSGTMRARQDNQQFDDLPNIWVADLDSVNTCTTNGPDGSMNPVYPDPGPDVEYGNGLGPSSPASSGNCEVPAAQRIVVAPSYSFDPASSTSVISLSGSSDSTSSATPAASSIPATMTLSTSYIQSTASAVSSTAFATLASTTFPSLSTMTITLDCPATITITLPPTNMPATYTVSSPTSACTGTSALCPCANGFSCMAVGSCTWECLAASMTALSSFRTSRLYSGQPTSTSAAAPSPTLTSQPASSPPQATSASNPGFANVNDLRSYLPCAPGTFICTDASTFYTCATEADGTFDYQYPRTVAAGMQCQPHLSPAGGSTQPIGQQGDTPAGYYRDDRYVRATPYGSCPTDGALQCTNGGQGFQICDQGGWVDMGSVAAGTVCQNGQIVSA